MASLLDTHVFLWYLNGSAELSKKAIKEIEDPKSIKYISVVTFWEIAIKLSLGKLEIEVPFKELQIQAIKNGFEILPLTFDHSLKLLELDFHHRDPFDRMIISQSITENITVISKDRNFSLYPINLLW